MSVRDILFLFFISALVVQWIARKIPVLEMWVRLLPRALLEAAQYIVLDDILCSFFVCLEIRGVMITCKVTMIARGVSMITQPGAMSGPGLSLLFLNE